MVDVRLPAMPFWSGAIMISQYVAIVGLMIVRGSVRGGRNMIVVPWASAELELGPLEALSA